MAHVPQRRTRNISVVAGAAIPAVVFGSLAGPALAIEAPARSGLQPRLVTGANLQAAEARISAHLVASRVPSLGAAAPKAPATTVRVKGGDTLSGIAKKYGVDVAALVKLNKLPSANVIGVGQVLTLRGKSTTSSAPATKVATGTAITYTVASGDTLSGIAARHGLTLAQVLASSGLNRNSTIYVNQKIKLSGTRAKPAAAAANPAGPKHSAGPSSYTVVAGDTLSRIAARHDMSLAELLATTGLRASDTIFVNQKLNLGGGQAKAPTASTAPKAPAATAATAATATAGTGSHLVRSGDTLYGIARAKGVSLATLLTANGFTSSTIIYPGQKLKLSGVANSTPKPATSNQGSTTKPLVSNQFLHYTYPGATVASANENKRELLSRNLPSRAAMQVMIASTARSMGVDPSLALAHAFQESSFDMASVSPANAIGVMQVIPSSGKWASDLVGRPLDLLVPQDNVTAGIAIIRALQKTSPNLDIGIASYYQGQGGVRKYGMYPDTKRYVASVRTHMLRF
ncbi:lytic transglycosylase domain-containing protein [Paeniglutamicibacter cryotolerans]|uniref:LysM repeat protein n=1 Tax=Paeniglutamicibacter cryotolerans TaxID=670079 RepID=A0A839QJN1_9MICC|nr:lytic transglycosylase domain-containing protein [Paeniglutamicibacter cryotolerans]MBB2996618.1 LysM repeat protein [Paeniglutamicibacter cryotolerans]